MKTKLFSLTFFLSIVIISAQKSSPIAGDASLLIDLLNKDYNFIENENFYEDLARDQNKAIKIFKTYYKDLTFNDTKIEYDYVFLNRGSLDIKGLNEKLVKLKAELLQTEGNEKKDKLNKIAEIKLKISKFQIAKNLDYFSSYKNISNEYIRTVDSLFYVKYKNTLNNKLDNFATYNSNSSIQKSIPFIGSLTFEAFIDGLSRFLVTRVKAELSNYVIKNIKTELDNPKPYSLLNELKVLLPETIGYINNFEAEEVVSFTNNVKQYIENDLNNLLINASQLKTTPRFQVLIDKNPDLELAFEALNILPQLSKIKNPIDYFDLLEQNQVLIDWSNQGGQEKKNIVNSIKLVNLIAHSLTIVDNGELKFVSTDFMTNYGSKPEFFLLYFGFLHEQNKNYYDIKFYGNDLGINKVFAKFKPDSVLQFEPTIKKVQMSLASVVKNAEKIYQQAKKIKKINKDEKQNITPELIYSFINDFVDFLQQLTKTGDFIADEAFKIEKLNINKKLSPYLNTAKNVSSIVLDLQKKRYATAIIKTIEIPSNLSSYSISLEELLDLPKSVSSIPTLYYTQQLFKNYSEKPKNEEDENQLIDMLGIYSYSLKNSESIELKKLGGELDAFLKTLLTSKDYNYDDELENLKKSINPKVLSELVAPLIRIVKSKISSKINSNLEAQINKYFSIYVKIELGLYKNNDELLKEKKKLSSEKNELLNLLRKDMPQLAIRTFRVKDKNAVKIIHFLGDIADSNNAEDVEKAFENFALPSGSYSMKKGAFNVSVNSYPGIFGGYDFNQYKDNFITGVTAPIGLSTTTFFKGVYFFVPIIDIAAPFRLRFDSDNKTEVISDFNFKNIFSPGAFVIVPLGNSPFVFNFGAQYGPQLKFTDSALQNSPNLTFDKSSWNIRFGVSIDIPVFNLYHRPKK